MLNTLRIALVACCLLAFTLLAQARPVPYKVFGLRPSNGDRQRVMNLGASKSRARQVLGPPTKISRFYYEIERAWATVWHYGPNKLFFLADRLDIVELYDNRWIVGKPGTPGFRVGSVPKMTKPSTGAAAPLAFGNFALENKPGTTRNLPYTAISYDNFKLPQGGVSDDGYEILFDKQGKVSHVFFGSN
ncbi:MAG: hypothetical protein ACRYG7_49380 [Janthinobacterium lividum]